MILYAIMSVNTYNKNKKTIDLPGYFVYGINVMDYKAVYSDKFDGGGFFIEIRRFHRFIR